MTIIGARQIYRIPIPKIFHIEMEYYIQMHYRIKPLQKTFSIIIYTYYIQRNKYFRKWCCWKSRVTATFFFNKKKPLFDKRANNKFVWGTDNNSSLFNFNEFRKFLDCYDKTIPSRHGLYTTKPPKPINSFSTAQNRRQK